MRTFKWFVFFISCSFVSDSFAQRYKDCLLYISESAEHPTHVAVVVIRNNYIIHTCRKNAD